ncbi:GNAT family N-acetyltransferase [Cohnella sp. CFH 77786]|uniref:GNAT family N-acetyltransferase n=1 Tax=Cohnella sp. CFH 77786 TaxID=2662265 RepID=UPI001C610F4A|nr:GNAT family N-acetyltransferase [Cohnella sp. CFH 77786]MBW5445617.1 GNAT family N-acetyltransferase [Cohnella sp. CFH 77786]
MQIRSFQLSDYRSVAELLNEVLSEECCEETMGAFARQLSLDSDLVLVASVEDAVIGVLIGTIDQQKGYLYRVAVHKDYQRQGIGKALVEAMNARFRQRNVLKVLIAGDKHNELLRPFYEALGVSPVDFRSPARPLAIVAG